MVRLEGANMSKEEEMKAHIEGRRVELENELISMEKRVEELQEQMQGVRIALDEIHKMSFVLKR